NEKNKLLACKGIRKRYEKKRAQLGKISGFITQDTINEIRILANGIMFEGGLTGLYRDDQTDLCAEPIERFRKYYAKLSRPEKDYLESYMIIRTDSIGSGSYKFEFLWNQLIEHGTCTYVCGFWFCKMVYDHDRSQSFNIKSKPDKDAAVVDIGAQE